MTILRVLPRLVFAFVLSLMCIANVRADEFKIEDGFVSMFNGSDFSGWQFDQRYTLPEKTPENWKVEDGVIKLSGGGRPYLGSQWDYVDFDMRFQWRAMREKYNSGFFIRSNRKVGNNQINLAKGGEGRFFGGKMTGGKPVPELQKPAMQWNDWRVKVVGKTVKFWCNGELAWEGTDFESTRGHIGLQAEGAPLEFRRLRIQEIGSESLSDPRKWKRASADQWSRGAYGNIFEPSGITRVKPDNQYEDYVFRLEWRSEKQLTGDIGIINGTKLTVVRIGEPNGQFIEGTKPSEIVDNPTGQWNYLQLTLNDDKLTVRQNGRDVVKDFNTNNGQAVDGGLILFRANESGLQFRNMRITTVSP